MKLHLRLAVAVLLLGFALSSGLAPAQAPTTRAAASGKLERLFKESRGAKFEWGVVAGWADDPKPFFEHQPDLPLIPASNEKLMTAAAAVLALGMQHEMKTELIGHGPVQDGTLRGALRVRGEGDPTFGARDQGETLVKLMFFAERLKARGITKIAGPILVDDSAFDQELTGPEWPTSDARTTYYLAEVSALAIDDGCVHVMVTPGAIGRAPMLAVVPDVGHVSLKNGVTTEAAKGGGLRFDRDEASNEISVTGVIGRGSAPQRHDITVHDPAMYFGRALAYALKTSGIQVEGPVRRAEGDERKGGEVLLRYGTPLSLILPAMLKESINVRAEMISKHLGWVTGSGGTFAGGAAAVKKALESASVDASKLVIADGSGLSRRNRLTARAICQALVVMHRHASGGEFRDSLAEPGEEGTLKRRFAGLEGRLFAKTGTLNGVSALSGYVQTKSQKWIAFSILMNGADPNTRKLQDQAVEVLASIDGEG